MALLMALTTVGCASANPPSDLENTGTQRRSTRVESGAGTFGIEAVEDRLVHSTALAVPPDDVWRVLPRVYAGLEIPVGVVNTDARLYGARGIHVRRRIGGHRMSALLDCGRSIAGSNADNYTVTLDVISQVVDGEFGGSVLLTKVAASAEPSGVSGDAIHCSTTGALERLIADGVRQQLQN